MEKDNKQLKGGELIMSSEEIFEKVFFDVEDNEYTEKEVKDCFQLLLRIFSTDLGYISYD